MSKPRRPFPQFGGFTAIRNIANSNYNSLQVKTEKHASHGLYLLSAFTYSKAINDLPEICCAAPFAQNSYDLAAERGVADFNQKLRWVLSFRLRDPVWRQPFPSGQSRRGCGARGMARSVAFIHWPADSHSRAYPADDPSNTGTPRDSPARSAAGMATCPAASALPITGSTLTLSPCSRTSFSALATPRATA